MGTYRQREADVVEVTSDVTGIDFSLEPSPPAVAAGQEDGLFALVLEGRRDDWTTQIPCADSGKLLFSEK